MDQGNLWKLTTIGLFVVAATALITGVVVAHYAGNEKPDPTSAETEAATERIGLRSTQSLPPAPMEQGEQAPAPPVPPTPRGEHRGPVAQVASAQPAAADIRACNRYANSIGRNKTAETLSGALIGGAVGAGLGAAGGAIAGGGGGAGKGAGIGGLVGVAAGTVYGLNKANQHDARAAAAYQACMKRRGYID